MSARANSNQWEPEWLNGRHLLADDDQSALSLQLGGIEVRGDVVGGDGAVNGVQGLLEGLEGTSRHHWGLVGSMRPSSSQKATKDLQQSNPGQR